jgi:hypothetical protein
VLTDEFFEVKIGLGVGSSVSKLYEPIALMISFFESNVLFYFYSFKSYFVETSLDIRNF